MAPHAIGIEAVTDTEAILIPDPLTADTVAARRAKSGKLIAGTAAYTSSDFFKHAVSILLLLFKKFLLKTTVLWKTKSQEI
jgi:aromatic amino acid aminotransferase I